jgi:N-acetylmuramoyl-L-alanine amidase CwlA
MLQYLSKFFKWSIPDNINDSGNQTTSQESQEQSSNVSSVPINLSHTHSKEGGESNLETGNTEIESGEKNQPASATNISTVEVSNQKVIKFESTVATDTVYQTKIPSYHEKIRQELQSQFDNPPSGKILKLTPQEYPGPLTIKKPIIIDGKGSTL